MTRPLLLAVVIALVAAVEPPRRAPRPARRGQEVRGEQEVRARPRARRADRPHRQVLPRAWRPRDRLRHRRPRPRLHIGDTQRPPPLPRLPVAPVSLRVEGDAFELPFYVGVGGRFWDSDFCDRTNTVPTRSASACRSASRSTSTTCRSTSSCSSCSTLDFYRNYGPHSVFSTSTSRSASGSGSS